MRFMHVVDAEHKLDSARERLHTEACEALADHLAEEHHGVAAIRLRPHYCERGFDVVDAVTADGTSDRDAMSAILSDPSAIWLLNTLFRTLPDDESVPDEFDVRDRSLVFSPDSDFVGQQKAAS